MYPWQNFTLGLCEHLAWPLLVAVCIFVFRKDIRSMLSRMTKLPLGAELTPETEEKQEENKTLYDELVAKRAKAQEKARDEFERMLIKENNKKQGKGGKK
ncbi:MAG: hypothetical protein IKN71_04530 [Alphaproteobacteria bacterium]|nr:hypothetical protein [Alphaproteobacteria bacterium]